MKGSRWSAAVSLQYRLLVVWAGSSCRWGVHVPAAAELLAPASLRGLMTALDAVLLVSPLPEAFWVEIALQLPFIAVGHGNAEDRAENTATLAWTLPGGAVCSPGGANPSSQVKAIVVIMTAPYVIKVQWNRCCREQNRVGIYSNVVWVSKKRLWAWCRYHMPQIALLAGHFGDAGEGA